MNGLIATGVVFDKYDKENGKVYISIPEKIYNDNTDLDNIQIRIRNSIRKMCDNDDLKVFIKIREGEEWTEEISDAAVKSFKVGWARMILSKGVHRK